MSTVSRAVASLRISRTLRGFAANSVLGSSMVPPPIRCLGLRLLGMDVAANQVLDRCHFNGSDVSIGRESFVNVGVIFDSAHGSITVGERVRIAHRVVLTTSTHQLGPSHDRAGPSEGGPIVVGDGAWIGAGALVMPGVTIGAGAVVASGSVVTADVPNDALVAGVPAEVKKILPGEPGSLAQAA